MALGVLGAARRSLRWFGVLLLPSLTGAVGAWGMFSALLQRRLHQGVTVPAWADSMPGFALAVSGAVLALAACRRPLGRVWVGLAIVLGAVWVGFGGMLGDLADLDPGSWLLLAPLPLALGAVVVVAGRIRAADRFLRTGAMLAAAVGAGIAALAWPIALGTLGGVRMHIVTAALMLVLGWLGGFGPGQDQRTWFGSRRHGSARLGWRGLVGSALALAGAWFAIPAALWGGSAGPAAVLFAALLAGAAVAARNASFVFANGCIGLALIVTWTSSPALPIDPLRQQRLATAGSAAAVYARDTQELQLWSEGRLVDGEGPDRPESELLATVLGTFLRTGDRVTVLGLGTGRLPSRLERAGGFAIDAVDFRGDATSLLDRLAGDGPVAQFVREPAEALASRRCGPLAALRRLADGSRQAIVLGEAVHARSGWQTLAATQAELRRVVGRGIVAQPFAMDRTPPAFLRRLLAAASAAHAWNAVIAVGDCAVLLSAAEPLPWPDADAFSAWTEDARWQAHEAHLGDALDLQRAWLGTVASRVAGECTDDDSPEPGSTPADRTAVLEVLRNRLDPPPPMPLESSESVLLAWVRLQAKLRVFARDVAAASADVESAAAIQNMAARFLPVGAPSAALQAALGLADAAGVRLRNADLSSCCAHAIDPTFFRRDLAAVFGQLQRPVDTTGALEDLAGLPVGARLVERCSGELPLAVALRARFPSRCARALITALAKAPLPAESAQALREVADPFVLAEAGRVLRERGAPRELLGLWRGDLPMPVDLLLLRCGNPTDRRDLVAALGGRRDAASLRVLADSLTDPDLELRRVGATSLHATLGDGIAYDPEWPQSRLLVAAERVRSLHNRLP